MVMKHCDWFLKSQLNPCIKNPPNLKDSYKLFIARLNEVIEYQVMSIGVFKIAICHTSEGF